MFAYLNKYGRDAVCAAVAALLGTALAACGGGSTNLPAGCPTPIPGGGTLTAPPRLLYPEPGATNVPDGNFTMITEFAATLTLSAGPQIVPLPPPASAPSPLPSPMATPLSAQSLQGVAVPALQSKTTYIVLNQAGAPGICNPPADLGSFTTQ